MASPQIVKCSLSPLSVSEPRRKLCGTSSSSSSSSSSSKVCNFQNHRRSPNLFSCKSFRISCRVQEDDNQSKGEEPPESLFMKELKKRGMTPISLLEESNRSIVGADEMKFEEEKREYPKGNTVTTDYEKGLYSQGEPSMAVDGEGRKGFIPRAELLQSLGGTFFSTFWRVIFITVASFFALYIYCGSAFVHDGSAVTLPQYVDPYALLEDEVISQTASLAN